MLVSFCEAVTNSHIHFLQSTFISSTIKIIFDIRFFSIVLTVVIMMFGDLMVRIWYHHQVFMPYNRQLTFLKHIAFTNSNDGALCDNVVDSAVGDFCATGIGQSYLRMCKFEGLLCACGNIY